MPLPTTAVTLGIEWLVAGLASAANLLIVLYVRAEVRGLRAELQEARHADWERLRDWINGSFMRASVAEKDLTGVKEKLSDLETNGCAQFRHHMKWDGVDRRKANHGT
jgi:hypothetical protein